MRSPQTPRERAARALCKLDGYPENSRINGVASWRCYLFQVDTVLRAALSEEEWHRILDHDK